MQDGNDFRAELLAGGDGDESLDFRTTLFVERVCDILTAGEVLENAELCQWQGAGPRQRRLAISAATSEPHEGSVSLLLAHFDGTPGQPPQMTASDANKHFRMLTGFLEVALAGGLEQRVEAASPVGELVTALQKMSASLLKAKLILITDAKLSDRVRELASETVAGIPCEFQILGYCTPRGTAGQRA